MPEPLPDSSYVHGTTPREQARLALMNRILNAGELQELALRGDERVLELGAGTGLCAREIARAVHPRGTVVAVERSPEQIEEARRDAPGPGEPGWVDLRQGDAYAPPLADGEQGSFDVCHARFLLEHVRDPLGVVRVLVRAARPGGRIVLADDDHELLRLWPEPEGVPELWRLYYEQYARMGNDPFVGRKLVELLRRAGARPVRSTLVFFGGCVGDPAFPAVVDNMAGVMESAREALLATGAIDGPELERRLTRFREWGRRDDAALWYGLNWAEGVRPAGGD